MVRCSENKMKSDLECCCCCCYFCCCCFFFFNDTATTEIYTLSLHDALPISSLFSDDYDNDIMTRSQLKDYDECTNSTQDTTWDKARIPRLDWRSEEHTSELQSQFRISYAVFCLKKKKKTTKKKKKKTQKKKKQKNKLQSQ